MTLSVNVSSWVFSLILFILLLFPCFCLFVFKWYPDPNQLSWLKPFSNYIYLAVPALPDVFFWQRLPGSLQYGQANGKPKCKQSACDYCIRCSKIRWKLCWQSVNENTFLDLHHQLEGMWTLACCLSWYREERLLREICFQLPLQGECTFSNFYTSSQHSSYKSSILAALIFNFSCL